MKAPAFTSALHHERVAALLGVALGVSFTICFATGIVSHLAYDQPSWWPVGPRPAGLYRVTQGLHVATGIATVPLLLVKLWVVYPKLWIWPPVESVAHAIERISLVPLVGGSLFLLFSGVGNLARWRPWGFFFTDGHYAAALVAIGGLIVHIGAKAPVTARALRPRPVPTDTADVAAGLSRRELLLSAGTASLALTVATAGQTVLPLASVSVLAPRDPRVGPQGVPVNTSASGAGVLSTISATDFDRAYRLRVEDSRGRIVAALRLDEIRAMPATEAELPITCVEGWSASARWRGVAVRDLIDELGVDRSRGGDVTVGSIQPRGRYRTSALTRAWIDDRHTILAYDLAGQPLDPDHGYPLRLIAPNRPGVLQTKWIQSVVVA